MIILNCNHVSAQTKDYFNFDFLNITEEESLEFVKNHNIEIPQAIVNAEELGSTVKGIIQESASNPNYRPIYNYDKMFTFAEAIKQNVIKYVEFSTVNQTKSRYQLQYNTVRNEIGQWVTSGGSYYSKWLYYNCYSYAINRCERPPFYYSTIQYQPGQISGTEFSTTFTPFEMALVVRSDLETMGYTNVIISRDNPTSTLTNNQNLICLRKGPIDYHFMKYDPVTNAWYHKPGGSAILKYNYVPSNDLIWYGEYSDSNGEHPYGENEFYNSTIYFIAYNKTVNYVSSSSINASNSVSIAQEMMRYMN